MEKFARIIVGYHGCRASFARALLLGKIDISEWAPSANDYDWLGEGIYFWEHSPRRARRWASERYGKSAAVIGAVIQLGACLDLLDEECTSLLTASFSELRASFFRKKLPMPQNRGSSWKLRELDCTVINKCVRDQASKGATIDTVRGAFLEGAPAFEGTTISSETHVQIAVRNNACFLGVFRPR